MLDVHPPHSPTHTWKDFFIHVGTICVGLLIAIGLEQTVESVHQHYELRETREALAREFEANRLKNNLLVLQCIRQHPGTPQTDLPGDLRWTQNAFLVDHAVWDAAEKNGITRRMPLDEANRDQLLYNILGGMAHQAGEDWNAINDAHSFDLLDSDPTHISPQRLDQVIQLTEIALAKQ
jgi:hypothetical protein